MDSRATLKEAYRLMKAGDVDRARPFIIQSIKQQPENAHAWWLAVFIAETPAQKRQTVQKVLQLDPQHEKARRLWQKIGGNKPVSPSMPAPPPAKVSAQKELPDQLIDPFAVETPQKKKKSRKRVWAIRIGIYLLLSLGSLYLVDLFRGGTYSQRVEYTIFGEPDVDTWVAADTGGIIVRADAGVGGGSASTTAGQSGSQQTNGTSPNTTAPNRVGNTNTERIPILEQSTITQLGEAQLDFIRKNEAHTYDVNLRQGMRLAVVANFTVGGSNGVVAVELWDVNGNLIAKDSDYADLQSQFDIYFNQSGNDLLAQFSNVHVIALPVPSTGTYQVVVVSRDRGPAGQYTLIVADLDNFDPNQYAGAIGLLESLGIDLPN